LTSFYRRANIDVSPLDITSDSRVYGGAIERLNVARQEQLGGRLAFPGMNKGDDWMRDRRFVYGSKCGSFPTQTRDDAYGE
jgi:hypothetical protein